MSKSSASCAALTAYQGGMALGTSRSADFADYKMIGDALLDYCEYCSVQDLAHPAVTVEDTYKLYPALGPAPLTHLKHSRTNDVGRC